MAKDMQESLVLDCPEEYAQRQGTDRPYTLGQIAGREEERGGIVFFDTCNFSNTPYEENFLDSTYDNRGYSSIDPDDIRTLLYSADDFLQFTMRDNVHTIGEVVEETRAWLDIVSARMQYYNDLETYSAGSPERCAYRKLRNTGISHLRARKRSSGEGQKCLMEQLCYLGLRLVKRGRKLIYIPENSALYERLSTAVVEMEDRFRLKSEYPEEKSLTAAKRKPADRRTDERLVAMAFYLSLAEGRNAALVTADRDIVTLARMTFDVLTARDYLPFGSELLRRIRENPPRVYFSKHPGVYAAMFGAEDAQVFEYPGYRWASRMQMQDFQPVLAKVFEQDQPA